MSDGFDYPALLREATLGVVRGALERAAEAGLPGEHHFYLTFRTGDPGVEVPASFRARYPDTMTIVLQHQYEALAVDPDGFAVTLRFGAAWERLRVPYSALTAFLDPSVPFGLDFTQFGVPEPSEGAPSSPVPELGPVADPVDLGDPGGTGDPPAPEGSDPRGGDLLPFRRP